MRTVSVLADIWLYLTLWATAVVGITFFVAGLWGSFISKSFTRWLWLPITASVIGMIFGFVQAAVISALIARVMVSVPYTLGIDLAAGIGIAQGLIFLYFHMGRAEFIHR